LAFEPARKTRPGYKRIGEVVAEIESSAEGREGLRLARQNVGKQHYTSSDSPIARLRLDRGWSQQRLADVVGTSQSHIARMESGRDVMVATLSRIARALDADAGDLAAEVIRKMPA
jgi:DNA-binding Xre family transcriptional regulator